MGRNQLANIFVKHLKPRLGDSVGLLNQQTFFASMQAAVTQNTSAWVKWCQSLNKTHCSSIILFFYAQTLVSEAHHFKDWERFLRDQQTRHSKAPRLTLPSTSCLHTSRGRISLQALNNLDSYFLVFFFKPSTQKWPIPRATRWHLRDMAVTWFYSLCISCITRTSSFLNFLVKCTYVFIFTICLLQPAPALLPAELCTPACLQSLCQPGGPATALQIRSCQSC